MSDDQEQPRRQAKSTPAAWLLIGVLIVILGAAASGGEDGEVGLVIAAIGGIFLTIGMIAKGVEVGIRNAGD